MDKLEINDQFAVILFEDKTGGAWCKKVRWRGSAFNIGYGERVK